MNICNRLSINSANLRDSMVAKTWGNTQYMSNSMKKIVIKYDKLSSSQHKKLL